MNKVTLEIAPTGWDVKILYNGQEYIERYKSDKVGTSKRIEGDFEAESELPGELVEALGDFFAFDVMNVLFDEL